LDIPERSISNFTTIPFCIFRLKSEYTFLANKTIDKYAGPKAGFIQRLGLDKRLAANQKKIILVMSDI
jgi:hypothetical protein